MPLVSVIMNIRNGAAFLREALDSVMAQTFTDWELIAWDDCSTDDSAQSLPSIRTREFATSCRRKKRRWERPETMPFARPRENGWPSWTRMTSGRRRNWKSRWRLPTPACRHNLRACRTLLSQWPQARLRPGARVYAAARRRHLQRTVPQCVFHRHEFRRASPLGGGRGRRHSGVG